MTIQEMDNIFHRVEIAFEDGCAVKCNGVAIATCPKCGHKPGPSLLMVVRANLGFMRLHCAECGHLEQVSFEIGMWQQDKRIADLALTECVRKWNGRQNADEAELGAYKTFVTLDDLK